MRDRCKQRHVLQLLCDRLHVSGVDLLAIRRVVCTDGLEEAGEIVGREGAQRLHPLARVVASALERLGDCRCEVLRAPVVEPRPQPLLRRFLGHGDGRG